MRQELININNKLIHLYKNNEELLEKQLLIKKILEDENCFYKLSIETSYQILEDLKIEKKDLYKIYISLI